MFSVLLTVIATFPIFVTFLVVCLKSHWKLKGEENQNKKLSVEEVYVKNDKPAPVKEKVKKVEKKVKKPEKNVKKPDGKDKKTKNLAKFFIFNKEEDLKTPIHSDLSLNSTQNTWKSEDDEHESLIGSAIFTDMENLGNLKLLPPQPEGYAEKLRAKVRKERKGKKSPPDYLCPEEEDSLFNIPSLVPDQATLASPKSLVPLDIQDSRVLRHQQDLLAYKKSHSIFSHASLPNAIPSTDSLSRGSEPSEMAFQPAFNARLINEVRKYPCLYNHSRRGSGDTNERQRLWESIAKNIDANCAAEFAKKRWLQLRDRYRKELKIAIKNGFLTPVRWCYFNQLSWLDPFLKDNICSGQVADDGKKTTPCIGKSESFDESSSTPFNWFGFPNLTAIKDEMEDDDADPALESSVLDRLLAQTAQRLDSISPEIENDESGTQSLDGTNDEEKMRDSSEEGDVKMDDEEEEDATTTEEPRNVGAIAMLTEALQKPSVETLIAANQARFAHHLAAQLTGMSSMLHGAKKSESAATPIVVASPMPIAQTPPSSSTATNHFHPYKEVMRTRHQRQQTTATSTTTNESLMRHHLQQVGRVALEWLNDEDLLYSRIIGLKLKKMEPKKRKKVRDQIMALLDETDDAGDNEDSCSSHSPSARDHDEECHVEPTENEISPIQL